MADRPTDAGKFPEDRYENREAALGGADAVEKTTYVTGKGTDPEAMTPKGAPTARVPSGAGNSTTWILIGALLLAAVLVYLLPFAR